MTVIATFRFRLLDGEFNCTIHALQFDHLDFNCRFEPILSEGIIFVDKHKRKNAYQGNVNKKRNANRLTFF